jgi:hypothetical protein
MKPFTTVAVVVFSLIAVAQLLRVILGLDVAIDGVHVPLWASVVASVVAAGLAVMVSREART